MTLLAAWVGVDQKKNGPKTCSLYIASDSRISWDSQTAFDTGQKVFFARNHPDIFGFCGDVVFAVNLINQLIGHADNNLLYRKDDTADRKFDIIYERFTAAVKLYPKKYSTGSFKVIYGTRDKLNEFHCYQIDWNLKDGITFQKFELPLFSDVLSVVGSGALEFKRRYEEEFNQSKFNNFRTSRTVYHCFTDALEQIKDYAVGGVPQIVGLYRVGPGKPFGIVKKGKHYFLGQEVGDDSENLNFVEWRNDLFERYDAQKMKRIDGAQRQPKR
jgi:hypothetical protein